MSEWEGAGARLQMMRWFASDGCGRRRAFRISRIPTRNAALAGSDGAGEAAYANQDDI